MYLFSLFKLFHLTYTPNSSHCAEIARNQGEAMMCVDQYLQEFSFTGDVWTFLTKEDGVHLREDAFFYNLLSFVCSVIMCGMREGVDYHSPAGLKCLLMLPCSMHVGGQEFKHLPSI